MPGICDSFQRGINYLRISVTDRCNLRCIYCMPPEGVPLIDHKQILSFEEIVLVVRIAVDLGIDKIRITGGEPLVRLGIAGLVHMIKGVKGVKDISLTTNGTLLEKHAAELAQAGLNRINISLDSLKPDRFKRITRGGHLKDTLRGIEAAQQAGLNPVKINMVPMLDLNDDEIIDFARLTVEAGWNVRFIEMMPVNNAARFVPSHVLLKKMEALGPLEPYTGLRGNGAARYFRFSGASGTIGFISPVSEPFCAGCNRLRLSAKGVLLPCLFSENGLDLRESIRRGDGPEKITLLIKEAIAAKPEKHGFITGVTENRTMSRVGG